MTVRGWQRAGALAATDLCGCFPQGINPVAIFVPRYRLPPKRRRSYQTVHPYALRSGVSIEEACKKTAVDKLHRKVMEIQDGAVVVCWEHKYLAQFASKLVGSDFKWPGEDCFDVIWLLRLKAPSTSYEREVRNQVDVAERGNSGHNETVADPTRPRG